MEIWFENINANIFRKSIFKICGCCITILILILLLSKTRVYATGNGSDNNSVLLENTTYSVSLPKTIHLERNETSYTVGVSGNINVNQKLVVRPQKQFLLYDKNNKSPITAEVTQKKTDFTAEDVVDGIITTGSIMADLTAGKWSGGFNFEVLLETDTNKILVEQNIYDTSPIPDQYNTGCDESNLVMAKDWLTSNDTKLVWRDAHKNSTEMHDLILDFRSALNNITEENANIVIENVDFTDYVGIRTLKPEAFDKDFPVRITFKNCKMYSFASPWTFNEDADIKFIFKDCTAYRISADKTEIIRCRLGGATQFRTENLAGWRSLTDSPSQSVYYSISSPISAKGNMIIKDCYVYDTVDDTSDLGASKKGNAYGIQIYQTNNITIDNCRVEIPRIPFEYSNGFPGAALYTNKVNTNIVIRNSIFNGGGDNYTQVEEKTDISITGCKTPVKYYNGIHWRVPTDGDWDWSIIDSIYVTSINKEGSEIKIHATNETRSDRQLRILTNLGETYITIPKFVQGDDIKDNPSFTATNIDYEVSIPTEGVEWIVCYDNDEQIRFVNYTDKDVYIDKNLIKNQKNKLLW